MRVVTLTSTERRHAYLSSEIARDFDVVGVLRESKGRDSAYEGTPDAIPIAQHFDRFHQTEERFFPHASWEQMDDRIRTVEWGGLNSDENAKIIRDMKPDVAIVFGCGIIREPVLSALPSRRTINLHQGLSPYVRGSGTNFWPFVEERPHYIGVTAHLVDADIDTGGIFAHARPRLDPGDTLHVLGCKTVIRSVTLATELLKMAESDSLPVPIPQWERGRLYKRSDLTAEAIRKASQLERENFLGQFIERQKAGLISPVRLISLET